MANRIDTHLKSSSEPGTQAAACDCADGACCKGMQIGNVAKRTDLSLRTIRYYEEEGLIAPSTRTAGGFRLYTEADCARLQLIKQMKPLGFSLDETRSLLHILDQLAADTAAAAREPLIEQLRAFSQIAEERCGLLSEQLATAAGFADMLRERLTREHLAAAGIE